MQKSLSFFKKRYEAFYHHRLPDRFLHMIGDGALVLLILFLGFTASALYLQQKFFLPASAKLAIILPGEIITVGTEARFLVRYENTTRTPLRDARILFQFHPFFKSAASSEFMLDSQTRILELGTIEANQEKEFILSGVPFGSLYDTQALSAELTFQNNKKEGREHVLSSVRYSIQKGAVRISCHAPSVVTYYQIFDPACALLNSKDGPVKDIFTEFSLPYSYTRRSLPDTSGISLSSKEKKELPLLGFFQKEGVGTQKISARAYI